MTIVSCCIFVVPKLVVNHNFESNRHINMKKGGSFISCEENEFKRIECDPDESRNVPGIETFVRRSCVSCSRGRITEYGSRYRYKHEREDRRCDPFSRCVDCHQDEVERWQAYYRKAVYLHYGG